MAKSKAYQVLPLFPTNSAPGLFAVNFDPSQASVADLKALRRVPKGSILLQYENLNITTCVAADACAAFLKCSAGNVCTAVVVQSLSGGGSGSNVTGLSLASNTLTLTQGAGGNQTVDLSSLSGTNTTTHAAGAGVAVAANTWTTLGTVTNKLVDWWVSNASAETVTHQVESRISGTNIQVRTNAAVTLHLHTIVIN